MLAVLASLAISAVSAQAIEYLDLNWIGVKLDGSRRSYSGEFNILDGGDIPTTPDFNPTTHEVTWASVWFAFGDDYSPLSDPFDANGYKEIVQVDLGLVVGVDFGPVEVNLATLLGGNLTGDLRLDLSEDGKLSYTINNKGGDFYVGFAKLAAEVSPRTGNAVPDGGTTAALLGLALLGLSAVGRKMRS